MDKSTARSVLTGSNLKDLENGLARLSEQQKKVVFHEGPPLLVIAGAGSGKTRSLTFRAARLIRDGCNPRKMLVSTFTNRATREFKERLERLLGEPARLIRAGTLHSTAANLLREYGPMADFNSRYVIFDTGDSLKALRKILKDVDAGAYTPTAALSRISLFKGQMIPPEETADYQFDPFPDIYQRYQDALKRSCAMDFDDLIGNSVRLLQKAPEVAKMLDLQQILVDEFQDTDPTQFELIRLLATNSNAGFMSVGDVDQSVYSFRGADPSIMLRFQEYFPDAVTIPLGRNYRSTQNIVDAAAGIIVRNQSRIKHRIWSENAIGDKVFFRSEPNAEEEARQVVNKISWLHNTLQVPWNEIAVLFRTNFQSRLFEERLLARQIPFYVTGQRFFERREIKDVLYYLRILYQPGDITALEEICNRPSRGVTDKTWDAVVAYARRENVPIDEILRDPSALGVSTRAKQGLVAFREILQGLRQQMKVRTLPELVHMILYQVGIQPWYAGKESTTERATGRSPVENLAQLETTVASSFDGPAEETLPEFLSYVTLMTEGETKEEKDAVQLLTAHASKGCEFRAVFVVGAEESLFPHYRALQSEDSVSAVEEERRLFYVAMTRAKERLYISHAMTRFMPMGGMARTTLSRFVNEIPQHLITVDIL